MNRRGFLRASAGVLAAAPLLKAGERRRIRIGFLGVAYSHAAEKVRILQDSDDFELVGVWAETEELRRTYSNRRVQVLPQEQVLSRSEVIAVESDIPTHAAHARLALEAGCHVHLEKPPAMDLTGFDEVLRLARERKRLLQVGYMWRHNPGLNAAFEAVGQGWLGEVYLVRATLNNQMDPRRRKEWEAYPGGVLFELGSHLVDAIVRLLGRPERVTSFLNTHGGRDDSLADNNVAVFQYPTATALITSSTLQPNAFAHRALEILGTRGTAIVRPMEPPTLELDLAEAAGPYPKGRSTAPAFSYRRYVDEFRELATALCEGTPLPVTLQQERDVQETLLRACKVI